MTKPDKYREEPVVPRFMAEATEVIAKDFKLNGTLGGKAVRAARTPGFSGDTKHTAISLENAAHTLPAIPDYVRKRLLDNLGMPSDTKTLPGVDFEEQYNQGVFLDQNIDALTHNIFHGIHEANPLLFETLGEILREKADDDRDFLNDFAAGSALAIEAYRIGTGRDLTMAFANLGKKGMKKMLKRYDNLPFAAEGYYTPSILDKVAREKPDRRYRELIADIHRVGEHSNDHDPHAMEAAAWVTLSALGDRWHKLYASADDLPPYEPTHFPTDGL